MFHPPAPHSLPSIHTQDWESNFQAYPLLC